MLKKINQALENVRENPIDAWWDEDIDSLTITDFEVSVNAKGVYSISVPYSTTNLHLILDSIMDDMYMGLAGNLKISKYDINETILRTSGVHGVGDAMAFMSLHGRGVTEKLNKVQSAITTIEFTILHEDKLDEIEGRFIPSEILVNFREYDNGKEWNHAEDEFVPTKSETTKSIGF